MLQLKNITKYYYLKDQPPVKALKGINLNFRRNEFVAILGHSGCGKTTLLNIIGGLDRYTDGDLIIEGRSTKKYNDGDWDTYRNHSIGFIFQSYNLITHQNILQNVELALTISGISKKDRIKRAKEALKRVGLEGLERKKPNQLSGGQMQRVAIARALVNNPEILLADEPTGALDSETSVQIMDLLKEVAKDRLVIMVTHNPDLAYQYANRIVKISDGLIVDDSNPYEGEPHYQRVKNYALKKDFKGSKKYTSMGFFTAVGLSIANLFAKIKRTILVVIAGSIGIVGVSAVLAVSHGVNNYIDNMQNDMLSSYPIGIEEETVDYTSLMTGLDNYDSKELSKFDLNTQVGIDSMIDYLMSAYKGFTNTKTNEINQELVEYVNNISKDDVALISYDYGIDVTNNIFTKWENDYTHSSSYTSLNGLTQSYISELKTVEGFSDYASYVDLFTDFMKELPSNEEYVLNQYDLLGDSKFATNEDEIMLVVSDESTLTDLVLAQLGYFEHDEFLNIAKLAIELNDSTNPVNDESLTQSKRQEEYDKLLEKYPYTRSFDYEDLLNKEFYYFPHDEIYSYSNISTKTYNQINVVLNSTNQICTLSYDESKDILSGIIINTSDSSYNIVYLTRYNEKTEVNDSLDILKGQWAGIVGDMNHYMILNINDANSTNMAWFTDDVTNFNPQTTMPTMFNTSSTVTLKTDSITGYKYEASLEDNIINNYIDHNGKKLKVVGILKAKSTTNFGCLSTGVYYTSKFADTYINDSSNSKIINDELTGFKVFMNSELASSDNFGAYVTYDYIDWTSTEGSIKQGYSSCLNSDLSSSFSGLFSSLTGVDYTETNKTYLRSLCGLKAISSEDGTYTFEKLPNSISIYPLDFESKNNITNYLDKWNEVDEHSELTYTDTISLIVAVIDTLINTITIALVAFTSLSLVVSCFMIAVITYISVMERVKEIGVIRSLGGRKKDVSRLFIAENLITGLSSGIFGIIVTYILCFILNTIISSFNVGNIGDLTINTALIMIGLSTFLSVISGFIPSMRASHQDPVTALRSE